MNRKCSTDTKNDARYRARFGRATKLAVATVGLSVVSLFTAPNPASAATYYGVNYSAVCWRQGHSGADHWLMNSPYSWFCYDTTWGLSNPPFQISLAGGLDINGWCGATYRGSRAVVVGSNSFDGWRCVR